MKIFVNRFRDAFKRIMPQRNRSLQRTMRLRHTAAGNLPGRRRPSRLTRLASSLFRRVSGNLIGRLKRSWLGSLTGGLLKRLNRRPVSQVLGAILLFALFTLLFLLTVSLPETATDASHDRGIHMSLEWYVKSHYQFGVDTTLNSGPYGFLHYWRSYGGILTGAKIAFALALAAGFAFMVLVMCRSFASWIGKCIWLAAIIGLYMLVDPGEDTILDFFIFLSGHYLLTRTRYPPAFLLDTLVFAMLPLLSLQKGVSFPDHGVAGDLAG